MRLESYVKNHPNATQTDIAAYFGCARNTVSVSLKTNHISYTKKDNKQKKLYPKPLLEYIRAHPKATRKDIAEFFNCSLNSVHRALERHDINCDRKVYLSPKKR